jgi:hypothetical protein
VEKTEKTIDELADENRDAYYALGSLYCKALKTDVHFTTRGWKHFFFDGHDHRRYPNDIKNRLRLFKHVPDIIKNCIWINSPEQEFMFINGQKVPVIFHELYYTMDTYRSKEYVTVVVRKIGDDPTHYYSVRSQYRPNVTKKPHK